MMKSLLDLKNQQRLNFTTELTDSKSLDTLVFEGSQGFLPTHDMEAIKARLADAFGRGVDQYLQEMGLPSDSIHYDVTFNKLHNDAFACDPNSASMQAALQAGIRSGIMQEGDPVVGWDVSCDARLFAKEYPGMPVITSGPGHLIDAHSDHERIYLPDLFDAIRFTALFLLLETGSLH
jgi:acetylornithine deacetylase/succinyl-diaminopimelate desuccinylase-like protein